MRSFQKDTYKSICFKYFKYLPVMHVKCVNQVIRSWINRVNVPLDQANLIWEGNG